MKDTIAEKTKERWCMDNCHVNLDEKLVDIEQ